MRRVLADVIIAYHDDFFEALGCDLDCDIKLSLLTKKLFLAVKILIFSWRHSCR
jgi:hypothetical protein